MIMERAIRERMIAQWAITRIAPYGTLPDTLGRIFQAFKSITNNKYICGVKHHGWPPFSGILWQRNYYEHQKQTGDT
jgi:hypothetical protein